MSFQTSHIECSRY